MPQANVSPNNNRLGSNRLAAQRPPNQRMGADKRFGAVLISFGALLFGGCSKDLLAFENFRQIQTRASTQSDVVRLIGQPDDRLGDQWMYDRPAKHLHVFLDFDDGGHVTRKQWLDAINNIWEDSDEAAASRLDHRSDSGTQ